MIERVIIVEKDGEGRLGEASALRRRGLAAGEHRLMLKGCEGGDRTEVEGGTEKEKARIVLCTKGKLTGEERAKRLEALRTRLASRDHLSPEAKAKIEAAIQQAIARARAGN